MWWASMSLLPRSGPTTASAPMHGDLAVRLAEDQAGADLVQHQQVAALAGQLGAAQLEQGLVGGPGVSAAKPTSTCR